MRARNIYQYTMLCKSKVLFFFLFLFFSVSVSVSGFDIKDESISDSLHSYKNDYVINSEIEEESFSEERPIPVIWERYFYPSENYQDLIRLCNRLNNPKQIRKMIDMLVSVEPLLTEYNRPKGKFYLIMSMMNERIGNKINANNYMLLALQDFDKQLSAKKKNNDKLQFRIYELQSIILNKKKRSNIIFFLFIALAGAFFFISRDSKVRHVLKKQKEQRKIDNPDSIDEDLIDKVNIAVNLITQNNKPNLSTEEIERLGFESKQDFILSFQIIKGMTPTEYYEKYIFK